MRSKPKKNKEGIYVSKSKQYSAYMKMIARCYNKNNNMYHTYGARGITVCKRWLESYANYYEDMGERPERMTLERIDNNGPYSPENCRWATNDEQQRNKTVSLKIEYKGKSQILIDWSRELNIRYRTLVSRLYVSKWPIEKAFETPQKEYKPRKNVKKKNSLKEEM